MVHGRPAEKFVTASSFRPYRVGKGDGNLLQRLRIQEGSVTRRQAGPADEQIKDGRGRPSKKGLGAADRTSGHPRPERLPVKCLTN